MDKKISLAYSELLKDESYSWEELAKLFVRECDKDGINEFIDWLFEYRGQLEDGSGF